MSGEVLLSQAQHDYQTGKYRDAQLKVTKALDALSVPDQKANAHLLLGFIYYDNRQEEQAGSEFALARSLNPNLELDQEYYSPGMLEVFSQAKQNGVTCFQRGKAFADQGKDEEAIEQLNIAINLLQNTDSEKNQVLIVDSCITVAKIYDSRKDERSIQYLQKALMANPNLELNPEETYPRLMELFNQAKHEGDQVVKKARELRNQKNFDAAIQILEKNSQIYFTKETKKAASFLIAEAHFLNKNETKAVEAVRGVLKLDPGFEAPNEIKQSPFGEFFEIQKIKISGKLPKILIVKGEKNPIHELVIESFKKEIVGEIVETTAKNVKKDSNKFSPDAIFVVGPDSLESTKKLNLKLPVIFANVPKGEAMTMQNSNVGGIYIEVSFEEQFSVLRAILPNAKKVGVLYNQELSAELFEDAKRKAATYNLELVARDVQAPEDMDNAFKQLDQIDAFWALLDPATASIYKMQWDDLVQMASKKNVPVAAYGHKEMSKEGALFSLSCNFGQIGQQAAELTQKVLILRPKSLPVVYPSFSLLALNQTIAEKLSIKINPNLITKDTVIYK